MIILTCIAWVNPMMPEQATVLFKYYILLYCLFVVAPFVVCPVINCVTSSVSWPVLDKMSHVYQLAFEYFKPSHLLSKNSAHLFLLTGMVILLNALMITIGFEALNISFAFHQSLLIVSLVQITNLIKIVPGNVGVTEFTIGIASQAFGEPIMSGVLVSVLIRISGYLLISLIIIYYYLKKKIFHV